MILGPWGGGSRSFLEELGQFLKCLWRSDIVYSRNVFRGVLFFFFFEYRKVFFGQALLTLLPKGTLLERQGWVPCLLTVYLVPLVPITGCP